MSYEAVLLLEKWQVRLTASNPNCVVRKSQSGFTGGGSASTCSIVCCAVGVVLLGRCTVSKGPDLS